MNHWGRIFFIYEAEELSSVYGQPLQNHVGNCRSILEKFDTHYFHEATRERLFRAVELHDLGKRDTFRIRRDDKTRRLLYSFAGHRFRVPHEDPYIASLIRAHHEFSVEQVNHERARQGSESEKSWFPDDLYLLCMADQLEAELAVKSVEKKDSVPRTFMEFSTERLDDAFRTFGVVPWPFREEGFTLSVRLKKLPEKEFRGKEPKEIERALKNLPLDEESAITITLVRERRHGN